MRPFELDGKHYEEQEANDTGPSCAGCAGEHDSVLCGRLPLCCSMTNIIFKEIPIVEA